MNRNLKISLLGLGSMTAVAAPVALAVSCGDEVNQGTLDVGLELAYAPYNFAITAEQFTAINEQANSDTDLTLNDGMTPLQADQFMEMIAPAGENTYGGGIDVYVANQVAQEMSDSSNHVQVQLHAYDWDALIPSMAIKHEFDAIIAGMTATPEREEQIRFTDSYLDAENVVVRKSGTQQATMEILNAQDKILVQAGTLQNDMAVSIFGESHVLALPDANAVENELLHGDRGANYAIVEDVRANVAHSIHSELVFDDVVGVHFAEGTSGNNIGLPKNTPQSTVDQYNRAIAGITSEERADMLATAAALAVYVNQA